MTLKRKIKAELSKLKFALGYNPKLSKPTQPFQFIPPEFSAVVTITADFELAWATRYSHKLNGSKSRSLELARRERQNISNILRLCEQFDIPITWATVGHLFLASCEKTDGRSHSEIQAVPNYNGKYWSFHSSDWFEHDPCTDVESDPEWYAPDIIAKLLTNKVSHEIGCHTFSHIDCRDEVCPPELFKQEIMECQKLAFDVGIKLKSFVHPGHTIGNLNGLKNAGFTSFQSDPGNILGYPIRHSKGFWELQRTMEFVFRPEWDLNYHRWRYKQIIDRAIQHGALCNFWFHPSFPSILVDELLPELFDYMSNQEQLRVLTVGEYVDFLNRDE